VDQILDELRKQALEELASARSSDDLEKIRLQILGKKGKLSELLSQLGKMPPDERKRVGQIANELKQVFTEKLDQARASIEDQELLKQLETDRFDASLPGAGLPSGALHPLREVLSEAVGILEKAGLIPAYGPEVELEEYCFDRLNFQPGHAARDMQATFFVDGSAASKPLVLRTHTSPVQVRVLLDLAKKDFPLPVRIQAPGRVYRVDDDATHSPMFHQIEGLAVDTHSGMGDLRAVLDYFMRNFFDSKTQVRFRPSYFPFTEPSAEVDISCVFCGGSGCKVCKESGWLEVAGAGLVHPQVFRQCGWDPEKVQGWAFGMGVERLAMLKLGIPDLRSFFENHLGFLRGEARR